MFWNGLTAKQGASGRVNGITNSSDEMIWNETERKEFWDCYFRDLQENVRDVSKTEFETNAS